MINSSEESEIPFLVDVRNMHDIIKSREEILEKQRIEYDNLGLEYVVDKGNIGYPFSFSRKVYVLGNTSSLFILCLGLTDSCKSFEIADVLSYKMEMINDEVIEGHRLYGKGLETYHIFEVVNSSWIAEIISAHSVHPQYNAKKWPDFRHEIIYFKECIVEYICKDEIFSKEYKSLNEAWDSMLKFLN